MNANPPQKINNVFFIYFFHSNINQEKLKRFFGYNY